MYRLMDVVRAARKKPESTARLHPPLPPHAATKQAAEMRAAAGSRAALQKVRSLTLPCSSVQASAVCAIQDQAYA